MTIGTTITAALTAVLANSWADTLPPEPTFPALVFEIANDPEPGWGVGMERTQHTVTVYTFCYLRTEISAYRDSISLAVQALPGYISDEESGDAQFEDFPGVYGYFQNFRFRT